MYLQCRKFVSSVFSLSPSQRAIVLPPHLVFTDAHGLCPSVPGLSSAGSSTAPPAAAATNPEPSSLNWTTAAGDGGGRLSSDGGGRLSSDDGDGEPTEDNDAPACHYSDRHPQPAAVSAPSC